MYFDDDYKYIVNDGYNNQGVKFNKHNIIICGTRDFDDEVFMKTHLDTLLKNLDRNKITIFSGLAKGPDSYAIKYAMNNKFELHRFPADWKRDGKSAGMMRNEQMAALATHCIAFWDKRSRGTADMIKRAKKYNLILRIVEIDIPNK